MARLCTLGFETQVTQYHGEDFNTGGYQGATPTTTNPRTTGGVAASCAAVGQIVIADGLNAALDRSFFARAYMRFSSVAPANPVMIIQPWAGTGGFTFGVRLETNGTLTLRDHTGTQVGSASAALSANTYYRIEHEWMVPTSGGTTAGTLGLFLDGATVARSTACNAGTAVKSECDIGWVSGTATLTILLDDVAVNDSTGAAQTGLPGPGVIVWDKPISDGTNVGFTGGAGGTTSLFDAMNNSPPTGAASPGTNASQIGDATNNATDNISVNCGAYTTAVASGGCGMSAGDTVTLVKAIARGANSTTTSTTYGVTLVSNPAIAEATRVTGTTAAAAEPTGWSTLSTAISYAPSVTLGTSPVVKFRKGTASANRINCDLLGVIVEYVPGSPKALPADSRVRRNTLLRR